MQPCYFPISKQKTDPQSSSQTSQFNGLIERFGIGFDVAEVQVQEKAFQYVHVNSNFSMESNCRFGDILKSIG